MVFLKLFKGMTILIEMLTFLKENKGFILFGVWITVEIILFALTITSSLLLFSGCETVNSCNYQVNTIITPDNYTLYSYEYLLNNRTGCGMWCTEPYNISTCPLNDSPCTVTPFVRDFCSYNGFNNLFYCRNEFYDKMFIGCLIPMLALMAAGCIIAYTYPKRRKTEETTPLYSQSQP